MTRNLRCVNKTEKKKKREKISEEILSISVFFFQFFHWEIKKFQCFAENDLLI